MPPGNRPRLTGTDVDTLKKWIAESAPSYPPAFDDRRTLQVMLDDLDRQDPDTRPYLRYFSLAHLVGDNGPIANLGTVENRLRVALMWCNPQLRTPPTPVDDSATLFRFDLRAMGWDSRELFQRATRGESGLHPLTPYDLILLEYPHGFRLPSDHPLSPRLNAYLKASRAIEPIPYLRADWLGDRLARGTPLAEDLKSLADLRQVLEKQGFPALGQEDKLPAGPETRAFAGLNPVAPAAKPATTFPVLPLGAWYSGDCRAEPPPFDLKAEAVNADGKPVTTILKGAPFRLRVTADRDVRYVLLSVMADNTLMVQPTNKGGFLKAGETTLLAPANGESFRIASLLTGGPKATEYFVLLASPTELPAPTIVKSRHSSVLGGDDQLRFPISRFFFDPETKADGFDPARVVRIVVPITVTEE